MVGARTLAQLDDALGALDCSLSAQVRTGLESLVHVYGERYGADQMRHLDSERR